MTTYFFFSPAKISELAIKYNKIVVTILNFFIYMFRHWQHLLKVRERSWFEFNTDFFVYVNIIR